MAEKERIVWVDYLKAFACLLVVIGHLLMSFQTAGIDNYEKITDFLIYFIYLFHMPLFMCMSGFLYCNSRRKFSWSEYKEFSKKKTITLIIPYVVFYLLFLGISVIFSSSVNNPKGIEELIGIFNQPMAPYWFLYALLAIFLVIPLIEKLFRYNKKIVFSTLVVFKVFSLFITTNVYFIDSVFRHGIYFYFGSFVSDKKNKISMNKFLNISAIIMYCIVSIILFIYKEVILNEIVLFIEVILAIIGTLICINIFKNFKKSLILDTFKKYTFQIYLLHTIFAAGIRIVMLKIGIQEYFIHLIIGLIASIYVPVLISKISDKLLYTNIVFYPLKTIEEIKIRRSLKCQKKN